MRTEELLSCVTKKEKKENLNADESERDDLTNNRSALLNSKAPYSTQEHAP